MSSAPLFKLKISFEKIKGTSNGSAPPSLFTHFEILNRTQSNLLVRSGGGLIFFLRKHVEAVKLLVPACETLISPKIREGFLFYVLEFFMSD